MSFSAVKMPDFVELNIKRKLYDPELKLDRAGSRALLRYWEPLKYIEPHWVMFYNPAAGAYVESGGKCIELLPDRIIFIPPFTPYSPHLVHPCPHYFMWFFVGGAFAAPKRQIISIPSEPFTGKIANAFDSVSRRVEKLYTLLFDMLLSIPENCFTSTEKTSDSRIIMALELIHAYAGQLDNRELAKRINISEDHFNHLFKNELGISPQKFSRQICMEYAASMLAEGTDIKTAAEKSGFADRYHFSKQFKNFWGLPPGEWIRKQQLNRAQNNN